MDIRCENCKKVFDSKIESHEDHVNGKCTWTKEDKKDYHWSFFGMFVMMSGLFGGYVMLLHTDNWLMMGAVALPTFIISQLIMFRVWDRHPTTVEGESNQK